MLEATSESYSCLLSYNLDINSYGMAADFHKIEQVRKFLKNNCDTQYLQAEFEINTMDVLCLLFFISLAL